MGEKWFVSQIFPSIVWKYEKNKNSGQIKISEQYSIIRAQKQYLAKILVILYILTYLQHLFIHFKEFIAFFVNFLAFLP